MTNWKRDKYIITELFLAQVNKDIGFLGTIVRSIDKDGHPTIFGRVKVDDIYVCAQAADQNELGNKLDQLVRMVYYNLIWINNFKG